MPNSFYLFLSACTLLIGQFYLSAFAKDFTDSKNPVTHQTDSIPFILSFNDHHLFDTSFHHVNYGMCFQDYQEEIRFSNKLYQFDDTSFALTKVNIHDSLLYYVIHVNSNDSYVGSTQTYHNTVKTKQSIALKAQGRKHAIPEIDKIIYPNGIEISVLGYRENTTKRHSQYLLVNLLSPNYIVSLNFIYSGHSSFDYLMEFFGMIKSLNVVPKYFS